MDRRGLRVPQAEAEQESKAARLGEGWTVLARDLEGRVRVIDPEAVIVPRIDPTGLLRFKLRSTAAVRADCAKLVAEYETKAAETCELCGSPDSVRGRYRDCSLL